MSDTTTGQPSTPSEGVGARHFRLFAGATLFCEAGEKPGFLAIATDDGRPVIPVFTSEGELARFRGAVQWFSTTGADLLDLVPDGYDFLIDPAGDHPLRVDPNATRRMARVSTLDAAS